MTKILKNEKGIAVNLVLAMVLVAVVISSMVSLINLNIEDRNTVTWQQDRLQQELLVRSESGRITFLQGRDIFTNRRVEIVGKDRVTTHTLNYRNPPAQLITDPSFLGDLTQAYQISAMCITRHSRINTPLNTNNRSPVQTYFEKLTRRSSLAQYQYFTDREISDITNDPNDVAGVVRFNGDDELFGRVHSNENIVIQNTGSGWPKFHDYVTTAGEMREFRNGQDIPLDPNLKNDRNIFVKGVKEWVPPIIYTPDAELIRRNGTPFGGDADIVLATINKNSFSTELGFINNPGSPDEIVVYNMYPDNFHPFLPNPYPPYDEINNPFSLSNVTNQNQYSLVGDSLWTNYVTFYDTTWTVGSGYQGLNTSYYTNGSLWVIGNLQGRLTLSSRKNSYILGNITYDGTDIGLGPDGFIPSSNQYNETVNPNDYFGLVSESSIIIKYKWRKPNTEGNMETFGGPAQGQSIPSTNHGDMYLYGAFSAQGGPDPELQEYAWKAEGVFTYEYQHPGSSPLPYEGFRYKRTTAGSNIAEPMDYDSIYDPVTHEEIGRIAKTVPILWADMHRFKYPSDPPVPGEPPPFSWRRWPGYKEYGVLGPPVENQNPNPVNFEGRMYVPWYFSYDYPWYNPVYPEVNTRGNWADRIRGTINLYGSIAQRRRGFIRRSGIVRSDNPDQNHHWSLGKFNPYGPVHFTGGTYVYGGEHSATGYNRNYYFDRRFYWEQPPDYPEIYTGSGANKMSSFDTTTWNFKVPPRNWIYSSY